MNTKHSPLYRFLVLLVFLSIAGFVPASLRAKSISFPVRPTSHICDDANLLSPGAEASLEAVLKDVDQQCGVEFLVVTIQRLPEHRDNRLMKRKVATVETYARGMFNEYRVGDVPANRGILLVIARDDRKCRIELGAGYGHQFDAVAAKIVDQEIVPAFRAGQYERGIQQGTLAVAQSIAGLERLEHPQRQSTLSFTLWIVLASTVASSLMVGVSLLISGKRGWGWVVAGLAYIQYLRFRNALTRSTEYSSYSDFGTHRGSSSGSGYSNSSYDSSFSGGDSCGGGFSDGGGASGSW